jgi:hypothetical protein
MTTITRTFSGLWISTLPLVVLFAAVPTLADAQTRIGSASSVTPEASGSVGGTLSVGSGVHANETIMHRGWATGTTGCSTSRIHQRSCRAGTLHIRPRVRKRTAGTFHTRSYRCTPRRSTGADRRAALLSDGRPQRSLGLGDVQSPRWRCPETATRFIAA